MWSKNEEESTDKEESTYEKSTDFPPMSQLEGDEEDVKERKELKILTPNQVLTRRSRLLGQIKAGSN